MCYRKAKASLDNIDKIAKVPVVFNILETTLKQRRGKIEKPETP
jgi:hypothetical protein